MIIWTRTLLSERRLFLVGAILCLLVAAVAGMHVGGHDDAGSVCSLAGLACALVVALIAPLRVGAVATLLRVGARWFARTWSTRRIAGDRPSVLGLSELCCLRV